MKKPASSFLSPRLAMIALLALAALAGPARTADAQVFGIGPRFSVVRGDVTEGTPATRFFGGTIRLGSSPRVALEVAMDFRTRLSLDGSQRVREVPIQGSLLLFPVRKAFAPYLLAGLGIYTEQQDNLDGGGVVIDTTRTRKSGAHMGVGAEIFLGRHAAIFADYRFRFVRFGEPAEGAEPINIPGLSSVKLSHHGSMWTSGMVFYF